MKIRKILSAVVVFMLLFSSIAYAKDWLVKTKEGVRDETLTLWEDGGITVEKSKDYKDVVESARASVPAFNFDTYKKTAVWADTTGPLKGYFFADQKAGQIMYYDGKQVVEIVGAYGILPRISKAGITYIDPKTQELYLYNKDGLTRLGKVTKSNIGSGDNGHAKYMSDNKIAWFEQKGNPFQNEVMVYDVRTKTTTQLTNGNIQANYNAEPAVGKECVAWGDVYNGEATVKVHDGKGVKVIARSNETHVGGPYIGKNDKVVYSMRQNGQLGFYEYNPKSGRTKQITNDKFNKYLRK